VTHLRDSAKAQSEAIAAFETALGRFSTAALERVKVAETALLRTTGQLEQRRSVLRRELARLRDEIESADDEDDTSHARRQYEEAEEALSNLVRWQHTVEASAALYLREAAKLKDLSTGVTAEARAALRRVVENLEAYFALQHDAAAIGRTGGVLPVDDAGPDAGDGPNEVRALASFLVSMPALRRGVWDSLASPNARLEALQEAENGIAGLVGRPALPVLPAELDAGECGLCDGETIWVNEDYLAPGFNQEMIKTTIHEGRHAYQYYACSNPAPHGDGPEVEAWRSNLSPGHYIKWKENPDRYMSQPVEADAFAYEEAVMEIYLNEGGD
jgi:hypothetical protein